MKKLLISAMTLMASLSMFVSAEEQTAQNGGTVGIFETFGGLIIPIALLALMYFFIMRPQKKQEKETAKMRNGIVVGDEICTIGGIVGRVVKINEEKDIITIETGADKNKLKVFRWAVRSVEVPFNDNSAENEK